MKYVKMTFIYMFKSFPRLLLIAIIPAILIGIFIQPLSTLSYLIDYGKSEINGFRDVLWIFFNKNLLKKFYIVIFLFIIALVSISYLLSMIERHFKVGRLSIKNPWSNINNSFFPTLKCLLLTSALLLIYKFLLVCLITLLQILIQGYGTPNFIVMIVVSIVYNVTFVCMVGTLLLPILLVAGVMLVYGYGFADSLDVAIKFLNSKNYWKLFLGIITPLLIATIVGFVMLLFHAMQIITIILNILVTLLFIIYIPIYVMVIMYDLSQIERRDLRKWY